MTPADLYENDFYEWTVRNVSLLRSGRASEADLAHIAEEIEDMGKRERRELLHRLSILIAHGSRLGFSDISLARSSWSSKANIALLASPISSSVIGAESNGSSRVLRWMVCSLIF